MRRAHTGENGETLLKLDTRWGGYYACVFADVGGVSVEDTDLGDDIMFACGRALGRLHCLSADFEPKCRKWEFIEVRQMTIQTVEKNNIMCAVINSDEKVFTDAQSALDVLMTAKYDAGTKNIVIDKKLIVEDFFILSTGLAGEILQKYTNYGGRIAIYGDYSRYTSKPLKDFIYESNKGKSVFFVSTKEEAIEMLTK